MFDYTAVDFETANSYRGSPCAVGLVRVRNGEPVDRTRWLMRPPKRVDHFDSFNVAIHGITPQMVSSEPRWSEILPKLVDFIGGDVVVAHNAGFDVGVIRYACAADNIPWPAMRFLCTMVLARRALNLPSYRLPFVTHALGSQLDHHHDPLYDADAVVEIITRLTKRQSASTLSELATDLHVSIGRMSGGLYTGSVSMAGLRRPDVNPDADPGGYLYGRVVVFTGTLLSMPRQVAWEECVHVGALPERNPTKRTNVLVVGDINPAVLRPGSELTGKTRRAFELQADGQEIEVMTEDDFARCLEPRPLEAAAV